VGERLSTLSTALSEQHTLLVDIDSQLDINNTDLDALKDYWCDRDIQLQTLNSENVVFNNTK
jgi:hypothetical protein